MRDAQVIEQVLAGRVESFEVLIRKYQGQLFASVFNLVRNPDLAEDVVQEAFVKAYEKLDTLKNGNVFYPWTKRIAMNLALNHFEKNKRMVEVERDDDTTGSYFDSVPDVGTPEDTTLREELRRYVRRYVDALPEKLRAVILMREVEDMSYEEISEVLDIPLGTVRSRLFNARQMIKERLINQGLADGMYEVS